jgi:hypothetical protein
MSYTGRQPSTSKYSKTLQDHVLCSINAFGMIPGVRCCHYTLLEGLLLTFRRGTLGHVLDAAS